jgi:hypothetical protein
MARDMNLFVDDDGTGYIIYSSEENATMFTSKLDDEYTDLATPADEAVLGVDYNRIFVNQSRESPAIFQHDERYFLITSGTTGWTEIGDPFPWWAQSNSWNSQPSSVIPDGTELRAALTVRAADPGTGQPGTGTGGSGGASSGTSGGGGLAATGLDGNVLTVTLALAALLLVGGGLAFAGRRRWRR